MHRALGVDMLRILRVVGSRSLKCGCFVGVYETYDGASVEIIEERGSRCSDRSHDEGHVTRHAKQVTRGERETVNA
jgi:hypothetical protein